MYSTGLTLPPHASVEEPTTNPADVAQQSGHCAVTISTVLERSPAALARVCSVLCLMNLVPESFGGTQLGDDLLRLDFTFGPEPDRRLDLLSRKLAQLTECLEVVRRGSEA